MRLVYVFFVVVSFSIVLLISGCGSSGSGGGDSKTTITGTLSGDEFAQNDWFNRFYSRFVDTAYAAGAGRPDKIVAVAKDGTILDAYDISDTGEFEIHVDDLKSNKCTLFVKNTVTNSVTGHIKLGNHDDAETLDIIDGAAIKENLRLGTMDADELTCPSIEDTGAFSAADIEFFNELANNDDVIASFQNELTNSDIESYMAVVFDLGSVASVTNNYFDIATFSKDENFKGMMPLFYYYGAEAPDLENITLYPPENIFHSDPNNTESDFECDIPASPISGIDKEVSYNTVMHLVTIETAFVDELPDGNWTLENADNGTILGRFVFSESKPFRADNRFKTFVPLPKINTLEDNVVSINLKFYRYDSSGAQPTNKQFFDALGRDLTVSYVLNDSDISQDMIAIPADEESFELQFEPSSPLINIDDLDRVIISYKIGGVKYQFFLEELH